MYSSVLLASAILSHGVLAEPVIPVNFSSFVLMDGIISGAAHIQTEGNVSQICDSANPQEQLYRIDVTSSTICDFTTQIISCEALELYEVGTDGSCCTQVLDASTSLCQACQWDTAAFAGRSYSCDWEDPVRRTNDGREVDRYTLPGPCDDYLWVNTNVSMVVDMMSNSSSLAGFSRITYVPNAYERSASCAESGEPCAKGSQCCTVPPSSGTCFAVDDCAELSPSPLEEDDTFENFVELNDEGIEAYEETRLMFQKPAECDSLCGAGVTSLREMMMERAGGHHPLSATTR